MPRTLKATRWTQEAAAREFKIAPATLRNRIVQGGILAGGDGMFSTLDICRAVYGDYEIEKLRDKRLDGDLKEIDKAKKLDKLIEIEVAFRAWESILVAAKTKIRGLCSRIEGRYLPGMEASAIRALIEQEEDEILNELSKEISYTKPEGVSASDGAAGEADASAATAED